MSKHKKHHQRHVTPEPSRRDQLQGDTRRFLPFVADVPRRRSTDMRDEQVFPAALGDALSAFRRRLSGMEVQHQGCAAAHLQRITALAAKVGLAADHFDDALHRSS
jgi:hypothetical protein